MLEFDWATRLLLFRSLAPGTEIGIDLTLEEELVVAVDEKTRADPGDLFGVTESIPSLYLDIWWKSSGK